MTRSTATDSPPDAGENGDASARRRAAARVFLDVPPLWISHQRLADQLGVAASDARAVDIACADRFTARLTDSLVATHGLSAPDELPKLAHADLVVAGLAPSRGAELIRYCGGIWHGRLFVREILATNIAALKSRYGAGLYEAALAHIDLAHAPAGVPKDIVAMDQAIARDGAYCVSVWLGGLPKSVAAWLRLGLADDDSLVPKTADDRTHSQCSRITRAAAVALNAVRDDHDDERVA